MQRPRKDRSNQQQLYQIFSRNTEYNAGTDKVRSDQTLSFCAIGTVVHTCPFIENFQLKLFHPKY